jgi:integrase
MDFIALSEARLEDLEIRRSKDHFKANEKVIKELLKKYPGKKIGRDEIEIYLREVARTSTKLANRRLVLIRSLYNFGISRGWLRHNPTDGIQKFPIENKKRYIPSEEDIRLVLETATCLERLYILVVAHTLGRVRSVNKLRWEDIEEDYLILYTRKAKNSDLKEIKVPLNDVLKEVLAKIPREGEYVFMNKRTGRFYGYRRRLLHTLCHWAGVKFFPYHALRHFGASKMDEAGVPLTSIQQVLGHEKASTTSIYLQSLKGARGATRILENLK